MSTQSAAGRAGEEDERGQKDKRQTKRQPEKPKPKKVVTREVVPMACTQCHRNRVRVSQPAFSYLTTER